MGGCGELSSLDGSQSLSIWPWYFSREGLLTIISPLKIYYHCSGIVALLVWILWLIKHFNGERMHNEDGHLWVLSLTSTQNYIYILGVELCPHLLLPWTVQPVGNAVTWSTDLSSSPSPLSPCTHRKMSCKLILPDPGRVLGFQNDTLISQTGGGEL